MVNYFSFDYHYQSEFCNSFDVWDNIPYVHTIRILQDFRCRLYLTRNLETPSQGKAYGRGILI